MTTNKEDKLYLKDILDSAEKIMKYTEDMSFDKFSVSDVIIDAVVRNFEIIGEAAKKISLKTKSTYKDIPWKEMAGMRDKMIHEYSGIDFDIVWKTIKHSLPELEIKLNDIYKSIA